MRTPLPAARMFIRGGIPVVALHGVLDGACRCHLHGECRTAGKHPIVSNWTTSGLITSETGLTDAIANHGEGINFGVVTGHPTLDGRYLFVVDVDTDAGKPGAQSMADLAGAGKFLPETLTVRTAGGGLHYYLFSPKPVGNNGLAPGVDIRGLGGQAVLPGSESAKGAYVAEKLVSVANAPEWVLDRLSAPEAERPDVEPDERFREPTGDRSQIDRALAMPKDAKWLQRVAWKCAEAGLSLTEFRAEVPEVDNRGTARCWAKIKADGLVPHHPEDSSSAGNGRKLTLTPASKVTPRRVEWTWQDRIPQGELTLTPGRAGIGKSSFHAWLIAKLTRGELLGVHSDTPMSAIIAATEDSWERTIVPRLMAVGAELDRVFRIDVIAEDTAMGRLILPRDVEALGELITENEIAIVSVDPLMSFLNAATTDAYKNPDVRGVLEPLSNLAHKTGVVVLGNCHFNKSSGTDALSRITGSTAFGEVARAAIAFAQDSEGVSVMSQIKNNLGKTSPAVPSFKYEITPEKVITADGPTEVGRFRITGDSERDVDEILNEKTSPGPAAERATAALHWALAYVRVCDRTRPEIIAAGADEGHATRTLDRALADPRFIKTRPEFQGPTMVSLAPEPTPDTDEFEGLIT